MADAEWITRTAKGAVGFLDRHKMGLAVGGAIVAGAWSAHPIKQTHPFGLAQQLLLGDPHAMRKIGGAELNYNLEKALLPPYYQRELNFLMGTYNAGDGGFPSYGQSWVQGDAARNWSNYDMLNHQGVSIGGPYAPHGGLVFGLYNSRLNG